MSGPPCTGHTPSVDLTVRIRYCADHRSWEAFVAVEGHTVDGSTMRVSSGSHTFGPFDSYTDVGHWLAGQTRVLKVMASDDMMERLCGVDDDTLSP